MLNPPSKKIVQQVQLLVITLMVSALLVLCLLIWNNYQTGKTNDIINHYHISSTQNIDTIRNALFTIKYKLKILPDNLHSELNQEHDPG